MNQVVRRVRQKQLSSAIKRERKKQMTKNPDYELNSSQAVPLTVVNQKNLDQITNNFDETRKSEIV